MALGHAPHLIWQASDLSSPCVRSREGRRGNERRGSMEKATTVAASVRLISPLSHPLGSSVHPKCVTIPFRQYSKIRNRVVKSLLISSAAQNDWNRTTGSYALQGAGALNTDPASILLKQRIIFIDSQDTSQIPSRSGAMHFATKASNNLRISMPRNGVALCFQPLSREGKVLYNALNVRANSKKDFEGKTNITETEKYLDLKNTTASEPSSIQNQLSSNSVDVNENSKPSSRTTTDNNEMLGNTLLSNSKDKSVGIQFNVSTPVTAKPFAETRKETTNSKQMWSSTSATVPKTTFDPFSKTSSQQTLSASRQRVLDALRQAEKGGKLTKFGQPVVPSDIFDEPSDSARKAGSEPFQFTLNQGQLFLAFSFLFISCLMFGTTYIVWKVGAIHYNEY